MITTISKYLEYDFRVGGICKMVGISVSYFYKIKKQVESGIPKNEKTKRIGKNVNAVRAEEELAVVEYAKSNSQYYHRELAYRIIDAKITYLSPTSVYRILNKYGLICKNVVKRRFGWVHQYSNEASAPDERWQTDITYLKYNNRDVYQLSFIDVYSRYIVLSTTITNMESRTVSNIFEKFIELKKGELKKIPILQSDNGSPYIGHEFKMVMNNWLVDHVTIHPGTPTENVIIERWHRTFKEILAEEKEPNSFAELEEITQKAVDYYNHDRYHQSLGYVTPFEFYRGNPEKIFEERKTYCKKIKAERRLKNLEERNSLSFKST